MVIILDEKLEIATKQQFNLLQKQIDSDSEMHRMLMSPMKDIPQYFWLYENENLGHYSLYDALVFLSRKVKLFFSKAGNTFTGFLTYVDTGKEISAIKIASFYDDKKKSNNTLAEDLIKFVEKTIPNREKIMWVAHKQNVKANSQYEKLLNRKKFNWKREEDSRRNWMWAYTVRSK